MTNFEKQLIKAMQHGCPLCRKSHGRSWGWLEVIKKLTVVCVPIMIAGHGLRWEDFGEEILLESECVRVECSVQHRNGKGILWTAEAGWIPELQEIVRGE